MERNSYSDIRENTLHEALARNRNEINLCQAYKDDLVVATRNLQSFQNRLKVDVMVPIGSQALMPGYLYHTNEVLIGKPAGLFIEATNSQAVDVVQRRMKVADQRLKELEVEAEFFQNKLEFPQQKDAFSNEDQKEIIEEYDEEAEKKWRLDHRIKLKEAKQKEREQREAKTVSEEDFNSLMENLDELELMEELGEEFDDIAAPVPLDLSGQVMFKEKPRISYELESFKRSEDDKHPKSDALKEESKEIIEEPHPPPPSTKEPETDTLQLTKKPKRKSLQFSEDLEKIKLIHKTDRPNTLITKYDPELTLQLKFKHSPVEFKPPPAEDPEIISSPVDIYKKFAHCLKHWSAPSTPDDKPRSILKKTNHVIPVDRSAKLISAEEDNPVVKREEPVPVVNIYQQVVGDVLERKAAPAPDSDSSTKPATQEEEPKRVSRFKAMRS